MISRIGCDAFGDLARKTWEQEGVPTTHVAIDDEAPTGAAFIFVSSQTRDNAIIVESGAAANLGVSDVRAAQPLIAGAKVFMTQIEQPIGAAMEGLRIARAHVTTILNPAPASPVDDAIYAHCDFATPNEAEAATLPGIDTDTDEGALKAAASLVSRGARNVVITLGAKGALLHDGCGRRLQWRVCGRACGGADTGRGRSLWYGCGWPFRTEARHRTIDAEAC